MNGENSNGILTQSHNDSEGRNIDDLTVAEAKRLGYLVLDKINAELYYFGKKKANDIVKNTNFENKASKADTQRVKA